MKESASSKDHHRRAKEEKTCGKKDLKNTKGSLEIPEKGPIPEDQRQQLATETVSEETSPAVLKKSNDSSITTGKEIKDSDITQSKSERSADEEFTPDTGTGQNAQESKT